MKQKYIAAGKVTSITDNKIKNVVFEIEAASLEAAIHIFTNGLFDKGDTASHVVELDTKTIQSKKKEK